MSETRVEIAVHERLDDAGYVVKITADAHPGRVTKLPVEDYDEAAALAESIARYLLGGGDFDVFLPDNSWEPATCTPGAP